MITFATDLRNFMSVRSSSVKPLSGSLIPQPCFFQSACNAAALARIVDGYDSRNFKAHLRPCRTCKQFPHLFWVQNIYYKRIAGQAIQLNKARSRLDRPRGSGDVSSFPIYFGFRIFIIKGSPVGDLVEQGAVQLGQSGHACSSSPAWPGWA